MTIVKEKRKIPSRYITYHFVCRECGKSDVKEFDKFTDPKNRMDIFCASCEYESEMEDIWGYDEGDELPF